MATLSFGENDRTCYGTEYAATCWQVVSDESANPGYEGDMPHLWVKLDHNHREVCKPASQSDPRYKHVADFIAETMRNAQQREREKKKAVTEAPVVVPAAQPVPVAPAPTDPKPMIGQPAVRTT